MKPKWLYRLESKDPNNGLWYNANAELVWGIGKIKREELSIEGIMQ